MDNVVVASSEVDSTTMDRVIQHHAQLAGALATLVESVVAAADRGDAVAAERARDELVGWASSDLLPHANAEERVLYPLAHEAPTGRLLVEAMLDEHRLIIGAVDRLREIHGPVRAAADATALGALFETHLSKENELILPLLASMPGVSLAAALDGMHEVLGASATSADGCGAACSCGESDTAEMPELDARSVPHAIRHATVFGALDAVRPGGGLVLVAPHDPLPLLAQLERRSPGVFDVDYLERGPEAWRLSFRR